MDRKPISLAGVLLRGLLLLLPVCPQVSGQSPVSAERYQCRAEHDPDGIGKFYMGREIAHVMSHRGAGWLDRPERVEEEQPDRLISSLEIRPGQVIADIGAGTGYFTLPLARLVGPEGRVLAVDIQPEMLSILRERLKEQHLSNVELVVGEEKDPRLPPASVDLALLVDVYHEFSYPWEMVHKICDALKPGGRLVFVEYRGEDPKVPIKRLHKMTVEQVIREMAPHPLLWRRTIDVLPRQHVIIFEKPLLQ